MTYPFHHCQLVVSSRKNIIILSWLASTACLRPESPNQVFCTIFLHQCFLSYHTWTQFSCSASCQTEACGFFNKQIAEAISYIFFAPKAFLKFAMAIVILCAFWIHCYLSFTKMIRARSQKRKVAAIVINSYLSSAANCMR